MTIDVHHIDSVIEDRCFYNTSNKSMFIYISKNASTSIRNTIKFTNMGSINETDKSEYFKFTVIRNPIHRVISSFLELIKCRTDGPYYITKNTEWYKLLNQSPTESFTKFLDYIDGNFYDGHVFPQSKFLKDKGLIIHDMDMVLDYDDLQGDYDKLIGLNPKLELLTNNLLQRNIGSNGIKTLLNDFVNSDDGIKNKITSIYQEDWDLYRTFKNL